jgi:hypothetical protein
MVPFAAFVVQFFFLFVLYAASLNIYATVVMRALEFEPDLDPAAERAEPALQASCLILSIVFGLFVTMHVFLAARNCTTLECFEMKDAGAFDVGRLANLKQAFGCSVRLWWLPTQAEFVAETAGRTFPVRSSVAGGTGGAE